MSGDKDVFGNPWPAGAYIPLVGIDVALIGSEKTAHVGVSQMPDFTMCSTHHCPICRKCRRHPMSGTVPHEYNQSWAAFNLEDCNDPQGDTGSFWPLFGTQGGRYDDPDRT